MTPAMLRRIAGRLGISSGLSPDDLDKALECACQIPAPHSGPDRGEHPRISANKFVEITELLLHLEKHIDQKGWHLRPRIYAVLRAIGAREAMPSFIKAKLYDSHLPFGPGILSNILGAREPAFRQYQEFVFTRAIDMELGDRGGHLTFSSGDDYFSSVQVLGKGGFGAVDTVLSRLTWTRYARKRIARRNKRGEQFLLYNNEISTLKRLKHHHLVQIMGTYTDSIYFAFLMRPIADGHLGSFLDKAAKDDTWMPTLRPFFGCIASTIAYLHKMKVNHMDLKLQNILIHQDRIYITDFGTARDWSDTNRSTTYAPATAWTEKYAPPEIAHHLNRPTPRNAATDMWSLGVIYLEMLSVLRGKTVEDFWLYLKANGRLHPHIHSNREATFAWLEILQESPTGYRSDNEPMVWVRDLIAERTHSRPTAYDLLLQIYRSSSAEQWHGICCGEEDISEPWDQISHSPGNTAEIHEAVETIPLPRQKFPTPNKSLEMRFEDALTRKGPMSSAAPGPLPGAWTDDESESFVTVSEQNSRPVSPQDDLSGIFNKDNPVTTMIPWEVTEDQITKDLTRAYDEPEEAQHNDLTQKLLEFDFLDGLIPEHQIQLFKVESSEDEDPYEINEDDSSAAGSAQADESEETFDFDGHQVTVNGPPHSDMDLASNRRYRPSAMDYLQEPTQLYPDDQSCKSAAKLEGSDLGLRPDPFAFIVSNREKGFETEDFPQPPVLETSNLLGLSEPTADELSVVALLKGTRRKSSAKAFRDASDRSVAGPGHQDSRILDPVDIPPTTTELEIPQVPPPAPSPPLRAVDSNQLPHPSLLALPAGQYIDSVYQHLTNSATTLLPVQPQHRLGLGLTAWWERHNDALTNFCRRGNVSVVRNLLSKSGVNPGTRAKPRPGPLLAAVSGRSKKHNRCARLLLQSGADPNARCTTGKNRGKCALHIAVEHEPWEGYAPLVLMLLEHGASANARTKTAEEGAFSETDVVETPLVKVLSDGYEMLGEDQRKVVAMLIKFGADVRVGPRGTGQRAIHLAVRRGDPRAVEMLLHQGAEVTERDGGGNTPWAIAVAGMAGRRASLELMNVLWSLAKGGANVDEKVGAQGNSALHNAAAVADEMAVNILVEQLDASTMVRNGNGLSAMHMLERARTAAKCTDFEYQSLRPLLQIHEGRPIEDDHE